MNKIYLKKLIVLIKHIFSSSSLITGQMESIILYIRHQDDVTEELKEIRNYWKEALNEILDASQFEDNYVDVDPHENLKMADDTIMSVTSSKVSICVESLKKTFSRLSLSKWGRKKCAGDTAITLNKMLKKMEERRSYNYVHISLKMLVKLILDDSVRLGSIRLQYYLLWCFLNLGQLVLKVVPNCELIAGLASHGIEIKDKFEGIIGLADAINISAKEKQRTTTIVVFKDIDPYLICNWKKLLLMREKYSKDGNITLSLYYNRVMYLTYESDSYKRSLRDLLCISDTYEKDARICNFILKLIDMVMDFHQNGLVVLGFTSELLNLEDDKIYLLFHHKIRDVSDPSVRTKSLTYIPPELKTFEVIPDGYDKTLADAYCIASFILSLRKDVGTINKYVEKLINTMYSNYEERKNWITYMKELKEFYNCNK